MIINWEAFSAQERKVWTELETALDRLQRDPSCRLDLAEIGRLHYLYQRASADLAKLATFAAQPDLHRYLEQLVARAYGEIHRSRQRAARVDPRAWLFRTFPRTFRRHLGAFLLSVAVTLLGFCFGGLALLFDPQAKAILMPFPHLQASPTERVRQEERAAEDRLAGHKAEFSSFLMTHNTRVSITTFALGLTYGVGTLALLFYNGVILGAVALDYIADGQTAFLVGWLLPHGSIEIPSILIAGQAGLMLAGALIGRGRRQPLRRRLAAIGPDLVTLILGIALMLVWAGCIEAFFSQYHEPVIPYWAKSGFGATQLLLLICFLTLAGRTDPGRRTSPAGKLETAQ